MYEGGVHVRTVVTREPEWDDEQQGWLLALAVYRAGLCQRCGGELDETTDPSVSADNRHATHRYEPQPVKRCHRCTALMTSDKSFQTTDEKGNYLTPHPGALIHRVAKVERPRRG